MSKIIKKIMNANQEYTVLGGGSEGETHEVITQAAYDQLTPAQQAEKVYMIKESGTPSSNNAIDRYLNGTPIQEYVENIGSGEHFSESYSIPNDAEILEYILINNSYNIDKVSPSIFSIKRMKAMPGKRFQNPLFDGNASLYYDDTTEKIVIDNLYGVSQLILSFY